MDTYIEIDLAQESYRSKVWYNGSDKPLWNDVRILDLKLIIDFLFLYNLDTHGSISDLQDCGQWE